MQYTRLGDTGLVVSRMAFGAMTFGSAEGTVFAAISKVGEGGPAGGTPRAYQPLGVRPHDTSGVVRVGTEHRLRVQVCGAVSEFERRLQHIDKLRTSGVTRASQFEQPAECSDALEIIHRRGFMLARIFGNARGCGSMTEYRKSREGVCAMLTDTLVLDPRIVPRKLLCARRRQ